MDLEKDFSDIITTIDSLKHKISNQEYIDIMRSLKNIFNKKVCSERKVICTSCLTLLEDSDDYDSDDSCEN